MWLLLGRIDMFIRNFLYIVLDNKDKWGKVIIDFFENDGCKSSGWVVVLMYSGGGGFWL